ncbi:MULTISPECIES: hypothetical protein [Thermoanaerobacterium]|uniref:Uncharacterized protein n=3 Tax=Thermoanaerobacterium TaxID=28895 RepID=L0IR42_THETR|nr:MULTISPECIES: hypothetical protein [Thermoanaerobacterium]AFK94272.1 hypothetical protein Tsac_2725 [Thermoanaerobacterium saccharolyticum JW/SL-YS485]AGB20447.1 hypothetical protein Thethe_02900 [Thermoanaerobacterium thermosaccharolyticum M0795]ETO39065.1 hypothetical protein V518_0772 [Thermoanaerobacterium aotearoense SCUT27]
MARVYLLLINDIILSDNGFTSRQFGCIKSLLDKGVCEIMYYDSGGIDNCAIIRVHDIESNPFPIMASLNRGAKLLVAFKLDMEEEYNIDLLSKTATGDWFGISYQKTAYFFSREDYKNVLKYLKSKNAW